VNTKKLLNNIHSTTLKVWKANKMILSKFRNVAKK